ncbi:MAG: hypothetical protein ABJA35_13190, partial [Parafilimonas sp.]
MKIIYSLFFLFLSYSYCEAQDGYPVVNFGDSGILYTNNVCDALKVTPDQKFVTSSIINGHLTLIRYFANGALDNDFGEKGFAQSTYDSSGIAISTSSKGNIIVAAGYQDITLLSFKSSGILDSTFGNNGISSVDFGQVESVQDIQLQTDGKIVVCGITYDNSNPRVKAFLARFYENGSLDQSFGINGLVINPTVIDYAGTVKLSIQADGKLLIGCTAMNSSNDFLISRYNTDGTIDKNFGNNGNVITSYSQNDDNLYAIRTLLDGSILAAGQGDYQLIAPQHFAKMLIFKYNSDGSINKDFGNNGNSIIEFNKDSKAKDILIDKDGNIILTGSIADHLGTNGSAVLTRLTINGIIDSSFGINGQQTTDLGFSNSVKGSGLLENNQILIGASLYQTSSNSAFLKYDNGLSQKQIIITKIKRWLQHKNGFTWDYNNTVSSYVVQRSYDGVHFSSVARINAGNSSNTYADPSPLSGNNYYRLQTTTVNGAVNYSNVLAVTASEDAIKISPNPA